MDRVFVWGRSSLSDTLFTSDWGLDPIPEVYKCGMIQSMPVGMRAVLAKGTSVGIWAVEALQIVSFLFLFRTGVLDLGSMGGYYGVREPFKIIFSFWCNNIYMLIALERIYMFIGIPKVATYDLKNVKNH